MDDEEMDGIALEQREKVETLEKELGEVRRRLERLYYLIEVPDLPPEYGNTAIGTSIWRPALEDARALLRERRITLNDGDTIAAFAKDMAKYLSASDIAESKAFIRSFVREVAVASGMATIRYTIPISQSTTKTEVLMGGGLGCRWEW